MQIKFLNPRASEILSVLRILSAGTFFTHGTMKLFGWPGPFEYGLSALIYTAAVLEVVGGILLILGLHARLTAFVMSGMMAFAYFIGHGVREFFPVLNGGESAMLFCFIFLYIAAAGPGKWSIDAITGRG